MVEVSRPLLREMVCMATAGSVAESMAGLVAAGAGLPQDGKRMPIGMIKRTAQNSLRFILWYLLVRNTGFVHRRGRVRRGARKTCAARGDRKSTRLNSSHS